MSPYEKHIEVVARRVVEVVKEKYPDASEEAVKEVLRVTFRAIDEITPANITRDRLASELAGKDGTRIRHSDTCDDPGGGSTEGALAGDDGTRIRGSDSSTTRP